MDESRYEKGVKVWVPSKKNIWVRGEIVSVDRDIRKVNVIMNDGNQAEGSNYYCNTDAGDDNSRQIELAFDKVLFCNPDIMDNVDDLTTLSYLNEPSVLHALYNRYTRGDIYTYCGIILVACNPFKRLDIYNDSLIQQYRGTKPGDLEPHLFSIAEEAYSNMCTYKRTQSIVISGESGAGKTVSAKYFMVYFASVSASDSAADTGDYNVEKRVLASNPIMEALGNAKTVRNNNSSRFGKYISIQFGTHHESTASSSNNGQTGFGGAHYFICGAHINTYLLEKSRVTSQGTNERGYHIFYHLCAAMDLDENRSLKELLSLKDARQYAYLNAGNSFAVEGLDDASLFMEVRECFAALNVTKESEVAIYKILAAILHLGNVVISDAGEKTGIESTDEALIHACRLLQIDIHETIKHFSHKKVSVGKETILSPVRFEVAKGTRDALAKRLYAMIFDWVVVKINNSLKTEVKTESFIGILDIYGFEVFVINSYEQFCINYANEKLQQQFNQHVFKLEQDEYKREGLSVAYIDFYDNQPCIDLIEDKLGILSLLDEETKMAKGSDKNFMMKLYDNNKDKSNILIKPKGALTDSFTVRHFAATVTYNVSNFTEKNKDAVSEELLSMIYTSNDIAIASLFSSLNDEIHEQDSSTLGNRASINNANSSTGTASVRKTTVSTQFKKSLSSLMDVIRSTTPHYCRCLKPNQVKKAFVWEQDTMMEQLTACGVIDTIRISALGYPTRWDYIDFNHRYSMLTSSNLSLESPAIDICRGILEQIYPSDEFYKFGKSKIFFKAGQLAQIEQLRNKKIKGSAIMIQKNVRGFIQRQKYVKQAIAVHHLQALIRVNNAKHIVYELYKEKSAIIIQSFIKMCACKNKYREDRNKIIQTQARIRIILARQCVLNIKREKAATLIQSIIRMKLCYTAYLAKTAGIKALQQHIRICIAKNILNSIKLAEKDVVHLKETSEKLKHANGLLEKKVIQLQQQINQLESDNKIPARNLDRRTSLDYLAGDKLLSNDDPVTMALQKENNAYQTKIDVLTLQLNEKEDAILIYKSKIDQLEVTVADLKNSTSPISFKSTPQNTVEDPQLDNQNLNVTSHYEAKIHHLESIIADLKQHLVQKTTSGSTIGRKKSSFTIFSSEKDQVNALLENLKESTFIESNSPQSNLLKRQSSSKLAINGVHSLQPQKIPVEDMFNYNYGTIMTSSGSFTNNINNTPLLRNDKSSVGSGLNITIKAIMIAFNEDEPEKLVDNLILDLDIKAIYSQEEEFYAPTIFIIFYLCIKYADYHNNGKLLSTMLTESIDAILHVISLHKTDLVPVIFWFSNTTYLYTLLNYDFATINDAFELKNFDISDYKNHLEDLCNKLLNLFISMAQTELSAIVVSGLLEHEPLQGMYSERSILTKSRKATQIKHTYTDVLNLLSKYYDMMVLYDIDHYFITQFFDKILDYICSVSLNNLFLRKELCHWSKALHITYNLSQIEQWLRESGLLSIKDRLSPILQAVKLLQLPKNNVSDVESILSLCVDLNRTQIEKILNMYTPESFEERVPMAVIKAIREDQTLQLGSSGAAGIGKSLPLYRDIKKVHSLKFFDINDGTNIDLMLIQSLEIPSVINCGFLEKTIVT